MSLVREMPAISILSICTAALLLTWSSFKKRGRIRFVSLGQGGGVGGSDWSVGETNMRTGPLPIDTAVM